VRGEGPGGGGGEGEARGGGGGGEVGRRRGGRDRWWIDSKATDEFLDRLFEDYFASLSLPNLMRKTDYHVLARHVPRELIDPEVSEKLDAIVATANAARGGEAT
jgi:hypothetical protein